MARQTKVAASKAKTTKTVKKVVPKRAAKPAAKSSKAPKTKKIAKKTVAKPTKSASAKPAVKPKIPANPSKVPAPKITRLPKVKKTSTPSILGYTPAEYQKYKQTCKELNEWSNQKLKDNLKANLQSMSGNKDELIAKVADGMILGSIPRCTACYGGRPAFDFKKGTYTCKGYRDDTDFINCHKTFTLSEIKRSPWTK